MSSKFPIDYLTDGIHKEPSIFRRIYIGIPTVMFFRSKFVHIMFWIRITECNVLLLHSVSLFRYYLVWGIAEYIAVIAGLGYNPKTNDWDISRNANPHLVEFATNPRTGINNWNIKTSEWLGTYIYNRFFLENNGEAGTKSLILTFAVSALWHGWSIGYYIFFLTGFHKCTIYGRKSLLFIL